MTDLENKLSDAFFRGQSYSIPATIYIGLLTSNKGPRQNSTAYALNDTICVLATDGKWHLYKVTTAGTSAAAQPGTYTGTVGEAITDGTAVMTEQTAAVGAGTVVEVSIPGDYRVQIKDAATGRIILSSPGWFYVGPTV